MVTELLKTCFAAGTLNGVGVGGSNTSNIKFYIASGKWVSCEIEI